MEVLAPDLAQFWLAGQRVAAVDSTQDLRERETGANETALAELADRIIAARSIL